MIQYKNCIEGVEVVAYSSLGAGDLTSHAAVTAVARATGKTPAQVRKSHSAV